MNLRDAVRRDISFRDPKSGKTYQLKGKVCIIFTQFSWSMRLSLALHLP